MAKHTIVTGLAFGDEGKGSVVDYLVRQAENPLVVRFNGGSQAAHNVVTPEGLHHTFAQFGSGTLAGAPTHLSQHTILNPANMVEEEKHLRTLGVTDAFDKLTIAESALIITPYHIATNRARERARGDERHGSCGQGIGETVEDSHRLPSSSIRAADLLDLKVLTDKFKFWAEVKRQECEELGIKDPTFDDKDLLGRATWMLNELATSVLNIVPDDWLEDQFDDHDVIFEGAQGVLLDERLGFHPHTTWSKTTPQNAMELLNGREAFRLGVTRTFTTRHGAGPLVSDLGQLGHEMFPEEHNGTGEFQGNFRIGALDLVALNYVSAALTALSLEPHGIAVTHMERAERIPVCESYNGEIARFYSIFIPGEHDEFPSLESQILLTDRCSKSKPSFNEVAVADLHHVLKTTLGSKVVLESHGPTHEDKTDWMHDE